MAFQRADTSRSLLSRQWSTHEMYEGLSQILGDSAAELPDSLTELEAGYCQFFHPFFLGHEKDSRVITS